MALGGERIEERRARHGTVRHFVAERGQCYSNYECQRRLRAAVRATSRWFSRSIRTMTTWDGDADMNAYEIQELRRILEDMADYVEVVQRELDRREGVNRTDERVAALRNVAGRTPEEAALYLEKADALAGRAER